MYVSKDNAKKRNTTSCLEPCQCESEQVWYNTVQKDIVQTASVINSMCKEYGYTLRGSNSVIFIFAEL